MYLGVSAIRGLVDFFVGLVEAILGLRVLFRLLAANGNNSFVHWIYQTSDTIMTPFRGIFPNTTVSPGHVLDISALFSMLMYAILGYLLLALLGWLPPQEPRGYRIARRDTVVRR